MQIPPLSIPNPPTNENNYYLTKEKRPYTGIPPIARTTKDAATDSATDAKVAVTSAHIWKSLRPRTLLGLFTSKTSSDITLKNNIDELLKILPRLIRENDTVKGAIITALSGVVATREDIKDLIKEMDRRFEAVDRRFEQLIAEMNKGFADARREQLHLRAAIDNLGDRSGRGLQEAVLELMDELLVKEGVNYRDVQRMPLADPEGAVFFPGFNTDVDVVARNGEVHLFEVKYKADQRDVAHFVRVAQLYERQTSVKPAKLFVVTLEITRRTLRATAQMPVKIIAGSIVE